jgi:hypothetical protein
MRLAGGKESRIRQENDYLIAVVSFANGMLAMGRTQLCFTGRSDPVVPASDFQQTLFIRPIAFTLQPEKCRSQKTT